LRRVGTKNVPAYRIVVADGRSPRDGRFIENIGTYDPVKRENNFKVDLERANYWIQRGAQPSDTVRSILKKAGRQPKTA
jgi:small subunit ribosomal protein S16